MTESSSQWTFRFRLALLEHWWLALVGSGVHPASCFSGYGFAFFGIWKRWRCNIYPYTIFCNLFAYCPVHSTSMATATIHPYKIACTGGSKSVNHEGRKARLLRRRPSLDGISSGKCEQAQPTPAYAVNKYKFLAVVLVVVPNVVLLVLTWPLC